MFPRKSVSIALAFVFLLPTQAQWMGVLSGSPTAAGEDITSGLVAWWKLDGASGTSATDSSGNSHTGTLSGGATWNSGSVLFDGVDGKITAADEPSFDFDIGNAFTIALRLKWDPTASGNLNCVGKEQLSGNQPGYTVRVDSDNIRLKVFLINSGGSVISAESPVNSLHSNQWYHVTVTYSGSGVASGIKVYLDGAFTSIGDSTTLSGTILHNTAFIMGAAGTVFPYKGEQKHVRVYSRELTSLQVAALNTSGL